MLLIFTEKGTLLFNWPVNTFTYVR